MEPDELPLTRVHFYSYETKKQNRKTSLIIYTRKLEQVSKKLFATTLIYTGGQETDALVCISMCLLVFIKQKTTSKLLFHLQQTFLHFLHLNYIQCVSLDYVLDCLWFHRKKLIESFILSYLLLDSFFQ